jgi:DNA-binding transcriptional LysR family regulator
MQLETLKIFCDVIRLASFSRGAAESGISQSSASQAVHQLELRLGAKLIDRSKRPLAPTPHGRLYYEGVKELIARYEEIENRVKTLGDEENLVGTVRVAAIYSVGLHHMTRYVAAFRARYPGAVVRLEFLHPGEVVERVQAEAAELGLISFPRRWPDLTVLPWREEEMVVALHPDHRLADQSKLSVCELTGESLVGFDSDLAIRRAIDRYLRKHDVQMDVALEFDNIENIKRAVEVGAGVAILPRPALVREVDFGSLAAIPFDGEPFHRPLAILHRGAARLSTVASKFLELLQCSPEELDPVPPVESSAALAAVAAT